MANSTMDEPKLPGGYLVTPRVPQGLAAAVEGLTREVIRHSPEDIYVFAAHHFEKLLLLREQCGGVEKVSERDSNLRALREMSQALKMREVDRGNVRVTRNTVDQVGWSLNQTAKVLKRHRSIFGDAGRKISTDEVFRMANQKENHGRSPKSPAEKTGSRVNRSTKQRSSDEKAENVWKASTSRTERSWSNEDSGDTNEMNSETRSGPRIITRIPSLQSGTGMLAKDIKTELRKNRISSRERRSVRAKPEDRSTMDKSEGRAGKLTGKNVSSRKSSDRQKRVETEIEEKRSHRNLDSTRSSKERQDRRFEGENSSENNVGKSESRDLSMDRVKDYVVQRFATTKSLEELQSVNYVEKVQEIIDETGPIIKGKVDELKSGMIGRSKRSSWFDDARNNRAKGSSNDSESNRDNRGIGEYVRSKDSPDSRGSRVPTTDALKSRLTETQNLLENVSSSLTRPQRRSRSARSSRRSKSGAITHEEHLNFKDSRDDVTSSISDPSNRANGLETRLSKTRNLLEDISSTLSKPMRRSCSAKALRKYDDGTTDDSSDLGTKGDALKTRLDETQNLLEGLSATFAMPGHRVRSAKGSRNRSSVNANQNFDELSYSDAQSVSKVSLPAVRSMSLKSSSGSVSRSDSDNLVLPAISPEVPKSAKIKEELVLPVLSPPGTGSSNEDSKIGEATDVLLQELEIPEMPVEDYISEALVDDVFRDSLNVTPNFDSIPQRPDSLEPEETPEDIQEKPSKIDDLEGRLQEIQQVEKDIEEIFVPKSFNDPETAEDVENSNIKMKLQELEEAEKRIDRIFDTEVCNEGKDSPTSEKEDDASVEIVDELGGCGGTGDETRIERAIPNITEQNEINGQVELKGDEQKMDQLLGLSPETLNYTYVLTEGSPYDIPDTVTTVIIPDRNIESPDSNILEFDSKDDLEEKLSSLPENATSQLPIEVVADIVEVLVKADAADDTKPEDSKEPDIKSPTDPEDVEEKTKTINQFSKNVDQSDEQVSSLNIQSDVFGEIVKPEIMESTSPDTNFICGMENRHDTQISHQDLGRINEEVSEELEVLEDRDDGMKGSKKVETIEESTEETLEEVVENKEDDEGKEVVDNVVEVVKLKEKIEFDLSPLASRPELDSASSNETKESSAADEPLESAKCGISLEEEVSSETRSPESSNEVKETTLTDGLSLSLDPMRPYVPELNLDSLQDITVSSFKMTEDEYDNQGKGESENTNSITDTLTSDENHKIIDNAEFVEEATMEYLLSSSDRSKLDEKHEELENGQEEVVEEPIVKSQVEIKEDVCEKTSAYVTGPSNEEEKIANDESSEVKQDNQAKDEEVADDETQLFKVEQDIQSEEHAAREFANNGIEVSKVEQEVANDETKPSEVKQDLQSKEKEKRDVAIDETKHSEVPEDTQSEDERKKIVNDKPKLSDVEQDGRSKEQGESEVANGITNHSEVEQDIQSKQQEKSEVANNRTKLSDVSEDTQSQDGGKNIANDEAKLSDIEKDSQSENEEKKEKQDLQISPAQESLEAVKVKTIEDENVSKEETKDNVESQSSTEAKALEAATTEEEANESLSEVEGKEEVAKQTSVGQENIEVEVTKKDEHEDRPDVVEQNDVKSESFEVQRKEEIKEDVVESGSLDESVGETEHGDNKVEIQSMDEANKSVDLNGTFRSGEDGSDEILEESFVEEDTPLAVSRSASQCTTRRVSSGNLARLREDPSISWTEEVGPEVADEEDQISSKMKFSKIGGETIREQGSDEFDQSPGTDSPKNVSDEINNSLTKDSKAYHIYVPDVDAGEDNSTTDSSTVESAVTKIQARVRGFLTRRRLHRGQHNRSSTLGSIPSIQDSIAVGSEKEGSQEEMGISSPTASKDHGLENAAARIQSNYRRYKARNRLRREDAVQRTTLSLEKSFAESGLQHTGEFHDCVPLPIHDLALDKKSSILTTDSKSKLISESILSPSETDKTGDFDSNSKNIAKNSDKYDDEIPSPKSSQPVDDDRGDYRKNLHDNVEDPLGSQNLGEMFFGQSSNIPIIQFGMSQNLGQIVDLVVLAKEEAALQSGYLNFITSVEDDDGVDAASAVPMKFKGFTEDENNSNESLKEPLALSATPVGLVIEEVTSSGADDFMKSANLNSTLVSTDSSAGPEVVTESLGSPRAPCASSEAVTMSMDGHEVDDNVLDGSKVQAVENESSKVADTVDECSKSPGDGEDVVASDQPGPHSSSGEKIEENLVLPTESMIEDFIVSENLSLSHEKGLLGPESSVDSMECPVAPNEDKHSSRSSDEQAQVSAAMQTITERSVEEAATSEPKEENPKDEEPSCSNADESSSMLSFSMKVQDFLGLGSEDSMELHGRKPILEVTLTPGDLMKSMSLSQESQLAGERIESPITMVQMAPGRSESIQQEDLSENGCENEETNGQQSHGPSSAKSEKNVVT